MALIKDGAFSNDVFVAWTGDEALTAGSAIVIDRDTWNEHRAALVSHDGEIALAIGNDVDVRELDDSLAHLSAIFVDFPTFADGRGFSQARQLREALGFTGEIRARGHIIRDQYLFLHRCGVNAIEVEDARTLDSWNTAMQEFSLFYQQTQDRRATISRLRTQNLRLAS